MIEFVWDERGRESPKVKTLSSSVSVIDVILGSIVESFLESLDQSEVERVYLRLERESWERN